MKTDANVEPGPASPRSRGVNASFLGDILLLLDRRWPGKTYEQAQFDRLAVLAGEIERLHIEAVGVPSPRSP